jgi:hypothetical protein
MDYGTVEINRAPVFTLWGAVVAERMGYSRDEALSLGKVMAGLNAQRKGRMLGIYHGSEPNEPAKGKQAGKSGLGEDTWVTLCDRPVPAKRTPDGLRAVVKDKPADPESVERYLTQKFGEKLAAVREAMEYLAASYKPQDLAASAYGLYEKFRPQIPAGRAGWGAAGVLDLGLVRSLVIGK